MWSSPMLSRCRSPAPNRPPRRVVNADLQGSAARGVRTSRPTTRSYERIDTVHTASHRDLVTRFRDHAGRVARLLESFGFVAAASRLSDHPGDDPAARCQPGHHG